MTPAKSRHGLLVARLALSELRHGSLEFDSQRSRTGIRHDPRQQRARLGHPIHAFEDLHERQSRARFDIRGRARRSSASFAGCVSPIARSCWLIFAESSGSAVASPRQFSSAATASAV